MKVKNERKDEWINIEELNDGDVFEGADGFFIWFLKMALS